MATPHECPEFPLIYGRVYQINTRRTHGKYRGERYYHEFGPEARVHGIEAGAVLILPGGRRIRLDKRSVIIVSPKPLWEED
jgi:hypothetical protein